MVHRFRSSAVDAFLAAPIPTPKLPIDLLNNYWEHLSMCNHLVETFNVDLRTDSESEGSTLALKKLLPDLKTQCMKVNNAAIGFLSRLGEKKPL